jgi:hypothetical protein
MATGVKPPIIGTAVAGWRDAFGALSAMPVTCGITFVILLVIGALSILFVPGVATGKAGTALQVVSIISSIIQSFVVAPLAIAVHRYVLLGEVATGYALDPSSPRYLRFVGFAVLVNMLMIVPSLVFAVLPMDDKNIAMGALGGVIAIVLLIFIIIVVLRRAILFPAIAVDAPGATWKNARNDTKGNSWRVLLILICVTIPVIAISVPLYFMLLKPPGVTTTGQIAFSVISTVIQVPTVCAFAAVASHIFRALADSLARPPGAA